MLYFFLPKSHDFYFLKKITQSANAETITELITVLESECHVVSNPSHLLSSPLEIQVEMIEQSMVCTGFP